MSIVALKRKSRRFQAPISGNKTDGFSLNGGYRNKGSVGQTNLARQHTHNCCSNDPNIIKRSTMNTKGFIDASIKHPTNAFLESNKTCIANCSLDPTYDAVTGLDLNRTLCKTKCKNIWVKNMSPEAFSSGEQIINKKKSAASKNLPWSLNKTTQGTKTCPSECKAASYWISGKHYIRKPYAKDLNLFALSPSTYQNAGLMHKNKLPTPKCLAPFPMVLNHNSNCQVNFNTPNEARDRGALPLDWLNCKGTDANCCNITCKDDGARTFDLNMDTAQVPGLFGPDGQPEMDYALSYATGTGYFETRGVGDNQQTRLLDFFEPIGNLPSGHSGVVFDCDIMHLLVIRQSLRPGKTQVQAAAVPTAAVFEWTNPLPEYITLTLTNEKGKTFSLGKGQHWSVFGADFNETYSYIMTDGTPAALYIWNTTGYDLGPDLPAPLPADEQKDLDGFINHPGTDASGNRLNTVRVSFTFG